jgi:hypothetical protein
MQSNSILGKCLLLARTLGGVCFFRKNHLVLKSLQFPFAHPWIRLTPVNLLIKLHGVTPHKKTIIIRNASACRKKFVPHMLRVFESQFRVQNRKNLCPQQLMEMLSQRATVAARGTSRRVGA